MDERDYRRHVRDVHEKWGTLYELVSKHPAVTVREADASYLRHGRLPPDPQRTARELMEPWKPLRRLPVGVRNAHDALVFVAVCWISERIRPAGKKPTYTRADTKGGGTCSELGGSPADIVGSAFGLGFSKVCGIYNKINRKNKMNSCG